MQHGAPATDLEADVVIVGYGPVGATLANLLGLRGISTLVLEREASVYHLPRAVHFDDEIMRVFETAGLSAVIEPGVILSPGMRFMDRDGKMLVDWSRPPEITPAGWPPSFRFHQPNLEQVLRDGLKRWPCVSVRTRCDVFALDEDTHGVRVRLEDLSSGRLMGCRTKYVVGCDGARWLVLDFLLSRPRPDLGDYSVQFCDPVRPATYVRGVGERRRWEITLLKHEDSQQMTAPEQIWPLLNRWVTPEDGSIERAAVYTFHSVVTESWRRGRLLLAGDSAHQTPPFLGQGMCAGIRDAANLAWKLADVVAGRATDQLLDSYERERSPHVREYIERAVRLGGIINTKNTAEALAALGRKSDETIKFSSAKPRLGPGLPASDHPAVGYLAPQPTLSNGVRLDSLVGYEFALLATADFASSLSPQARSMLGTSNVMIVDDAAVQPWLEQMSASAVLVRPDRYVLGSAQDEKTLAELLNPLCAPAIRCATPDTPILARSPSRIS